MNQEEWKNAMLGTRIKQGEILAKAEADPVWQEIVKILTNKRKWLREENENPTCHFGRVKKINLPPAIRGNPPERITIKETPEEDYIWLKMTQAKIELLSEIILLPETFIASAKKAKEQLEKQKEMEKSKKKEVK